MQLSNDQQVAIDMLIDWFSYPHGLDDIAIVKGLAGTGKSTIMKEFMDAVGLDNENVVTLASSGIAVKNIRDKTGTDNARTIASFIKTPVSKVELEMTTRTGRVTNRFELDSAGTANEHGKLFDDVYQTIYEEGLYESQKQIVKIHKDLLDMKQDYIDELNSNAKAKKRTQLRFNNINGYLDSAYKEKSSRPQLSRNVDFVYRTDMYEDNYNIDKSFGHKIKLIMIDEIGMVGDLELKKLIEFCEKMKIAIVGLGDEHQLPPIGEDDFNWAIKQPAGINTVHDINVHTAELNQVHRQSENSYLNVLAQQFTVDTTMMDGLRKIFTDAKQTNKPVKDIQAQSLSSMQPDHIKRVFKNFDVALTFKNSDVRNLTRLVRNARFGYGSTDHVPHIGETILITSNEHTSAKNRLVNGQRMIITNRYSTKEIAEMGLGDNRKPLAMWGKLVKDIVDYVGLFDIQNPDTGQIIKKVWINLSEFDNPKIKRNVLEKLADDKPIKKIDALARAIAPQGMFMRPSPDQIADRHRPNDEQQAEAFNWDRYEKSAKSEVVNPLHDHIIFATFGYALTVHKAQGLEFDNVIYYEDQRMLNAIFGQLTPLRYTAITRAKKYLLILTS